MEQGDTEGRLSRRQRQGLWLLLGVFVAFGLLVEYRCAFLSRRMGDLGCYLRAGWAVRAGAEMYDVVDNNNWHYNYPPLLAILMAPLGDPPPGADTTNMVPYAASVAIWYVLSLLFLVLAVHYLATALERGGGLAGVGCHAVGSRRWWALRVLPVLVCIVPVGHTLMRGQVNLLVLALLCGLAAGLVRGWRVLAGMSLAGMICIKVFPAYLLVLPLWRRDGGCLVGCAAGLFLGMIVLPLCVFGPERAVAQYEKWSQVLVLPALGNGEDKSRAHELTSIHATDTQAFKAMLLATKYPDRTTRPRDLEPWMRPAHWLIGAVLTLITLLAARRRRDDVGTVLTVGALTAVMLPLCPVCHLHNMALTVLLVMGLIASEWQRHGELRIAPWLIGLFGLYPVLNVLPNLPGLELARDLGIATYASLSLWVVAVVRLRWGGPPAVATPVAPVVEALPRAA